MNSRSAQLFKRASQLMPGGVNSPVRAFRGVGGEPIFFESGYGAYLRDVDGNEYIDYVSSWGPMLQGYSFPPVVEAVTKQATQAMSFGAPTESEIELAELVIERMPSIEKLRMVNSGTEATMSAIRLARGTTGRDKILKFEGCFHGHGDSLLVKAGSGVLTLGLPDSPGVPQSLAQHTLTVPYNDLQSAERVFAAHGDDIAGIIVEPIAGNMGCINPLPGFLEGLRKLATEFGSLLILDEVMTGFRVGLGGAQERFDVQPDITTLGKVLGAGMPVAAFGGRAELMDQLAPAGPIYQSGTLSGNPLAMRSGCALLRSLDNEFYLSLERQTAKLTADLRSAAAKHNVALQINETCGMFSLFFTSQVGIQRYADVAACDVSRYKRFFHRMLEQGIYFAPSAFEVAFLGGCHDDAITQRTVEAADAAFAALP